MDILNLGLEEIKPYEKNPRNNDNAVDAVAASIREFGFKVPIIIDKDNIIVAGHTRYKAAKKLGLKTVPCIKADDLTDEQVKAFRLADNKVAEQADWDFELLNEELETITMDMDQFGFDLPEDDDEETQTEIIEDDVPDVPEEPKSKYGQVYQLGNHRLMCGDSTKKEDVEKLLNGVKADLLITDPPYNVSMERKSKDVLKSDNYSHIENDELSEDEFKIFLKSVFTNANDSLKDDASYYVFSCQGGDSELMMMMMMRECGIRCRHQIIWVKDAPVFSMGRLDYDYKHEPILYGWKKKHNFYRKGQQDKSVWEFKRTANKLHPTMKPVELIVNALMNSTKNGNIVIDLFGGSGSTLMACEQTERINYSMELDPHYVDVIIQRWENFTGKKAVLLND